MVLENLWRPKLLVGDQRNSPRAAPAFEDVSSTMHRFVTTTKLNTYFDDPMGGNAKQYKISGIRLMQR